MDCSLPVSSVHGILQARILEWVAIPFSRTSSRLRDQTQVSCIAGGFFTIWATGDPLPKSTHYLTLSWLIYVTPKLMETPSSSSSWTLPSSHHVRHASYPSDQWLATIFCKESYSKYFRVSGCMVSFIIIQLCYCRTKSFIRSNINEWVWLYFKKSFKIHIFIYDCSGSSLLLEGFL